MATVAVVAGAAASVAAAGASAYASSSQGKGGGGGPRGPGLAERLFNRGTRDVLRNQTAVMQDALAQAKFMQPELYRALGYEPIYDENARASVQEAGSKVDALRAELDSLQEGRIGLKGKNKRAKNKKQAKRTQRALAIAERQLGEAQTVGDRVVGIRKLDPSEVDLTTASGDDLFRVAYDLQNQTLVRALRGEEPIDATLKTSFEEGERDLRDRLRNHLGPDYETSTAGQQALANFAREKSEAFQQFNRQTINDFSSMTESRAKALSDLTGARLEQLLYPATRQADFSKALGDVAQGRIQYGEFRQQERGIAAKEQEEVLQNNAYQDSLRSDRINGIAGALGQIGGGLTAVSGNPYLSNAGTSASTSVANALAGREIAGPTQPGSTGLGRSGGLAGALGGVFKLNS